MKQSKIDKDENNLKHTCRVIDIKRVAVADTIITSISGEIFAKDSSEMGVTIDTLIGAVVSLTDKTTGKVYGVLADSVGKYRLQFPAATYDVRVQSVAYNTLIVQNVIVGTGDIVKFDALLGASGMIKDSSVFVMKAGFKIE